jgi:phage terminase large subunit
MLSDPAHRRMVTIHANRFLPPEYVEMLANLPDTAAGRRLGKGEWAAAHGVIWEFPDEQIKPPTAPPKRVVAGVDWGFVHAFACEVIGQSGSGRLSVLREVYAKGALLRDIIPVLLDIARTYPGIVFKGDPSEPAYIAECKQAGLRIDAARNDVDAGIQAVSAAIHDGMTIDPSCDGLLGELPGYTWMADRGGGFKEKPIEINDDACDALRYGVIAFAPDPNNPWATIAGKSASAEA